MDVGAASGGDGGPRRADSVEGGLEIVPLELYDSARAKIDANLRWLFAKAYGEDHVPAELRDPFYTDQYCVEHIKPPVLTLLLSAELYCRVCVLLLKGDQTIALSSHQSVIQALARRGIYAREPDDTPVTHDDLSSTPIKMSSHIPLIDALMLVCSVEMMSIERVVSSVKRFSTFSASKELPFDMEDAMLFWINKVILKAREISEKELKLKQHLMESPCHQKSPSKWYWKLVPVRYRRDHLTGRCLPHLPLVEDLMKDVCDGAALLAVIHYYCPDYMRLEDICLKEVLSISDSVYNIQLLREFSNEYLNKCLYLQTEDLLYAPPVLKHNVMVYIAELFWWFEVVRPDFVKPRDPQDIKDARPSVQAKSSRPHVPISNATKRSFLNTSPSVDSMVAGSTHDTYIRYYLHPEESASTSVAKISPSHSPSHQLLPLRQRQQKPAQGEETAEFRNRSSSLSRMDGHSPGSRLAWVERRQRPLSQMEMEWERLCGDNISLARSISKDSLASNVISITPRHQVNGQSVSHIACTHDIEDQEEELVAVLSSGGVASFREPRPESFFLEPLQPAILRPNKEKSATVSKRDESGEGRGQRRRGVHTPTEHTTINQTFTTVSAVEPENSPQSSGFFLHSKSECVRSSPIDIWVGKTSDSEFDEEEVDEVEGDDLEVQDLSKVRLRKGLGHGKEEEESVKLREEVRMREHEDKEGASGRSSPCPSTLSQASSTSTGAGHTRQSSPCRSTLSQVSSTSSRMTSFAERRLHRAGTPDEYYSGCSSQTTTPDGSECAPFPPLASDTVSPSPKSRGGVASELVHLRMQLEEKRRAIETQKKKMETLSARQRLQLGKAAFLHVVKKGRGDTLPRPFKQDLTKVKEKETAKDDSCVEALKNRSKEVEPSLKKESSKWGETSSTSFARLEGDNRASEGEAWEELGGELDLSECSRSIELLNDAIGTIQQQMMQLSVQQDLLMRQTALSPTQEKPQTPSENEPKPRPSVQFVEISTATRRPPKLSSGRSPRAKPAELKLSKSMKTSSVDPKSSPISRTPRTENEDEGVVKEGNDKTSGRSSARGLARNATFRLHDAGNRKADGPESPKAEPPTVEPTEAEPARERSGSGGSGKENVPVLSEESRAKSQLIEVDLSDLANPDSSTEPEGEQKSGLGFFFKDDQKAADELAKKRAAFLLKQQKKAEEARLRKQQLEAESELKRDEARRKAEEERVRKEEEKARRELIKQEYLRRKQQELLEEQGVAKPRPRNRKPRPKSLHRRESGNKTPVGLCTAPSGSSLSLASAATEADSVTSGGGSQRCAKI